jgi:hypothetical protein
MKPVALPEPPIYYFKMDQQYTKFEGGLNTNLKVIGEQREKSIPNFSFWLPSSNFPFCSAGLLDLNLGRNWYVYCC